MKLFCARDFTHKKDGTPMTPDECYKKANAMVESWLKKQRKVYGRDINCVSEHWVKAGFLNGVTHQGLLVDVKPIKGDNK